MAHPSSSASAAPRKGLKRLRWWLSPWRLFVLLVLGAVMTVGSAWGAAVWSPAPGLVSWGSNGYAASGVQASTNSLGFSSDICMVMRGPGMEPKLPGPEPAPWAVLPGEPTLVTPRLNAAVWAGGMTTVREVRTSAFGLPWRSMRWWSDFPPASGMSPGLVWAPDQPIDRHWCIEIAPGVQYKDVKGLPLNVYVQGFLFDALFWMVTAVVCVEGVAVVRRARLARVRRLLNLCHHCGYDRAGLGAGAVCPECGRAGGAE